MKIVEQSFKTDGYISTNAIYLIERAGRTCYRSTPGDPEKFIRMLIKKGHESVLEHAAATVKIITSRAVTHELVRHRLASYSQESQRYVSYADGVTFIHPTWWKEASYDAREKWTDAMRYAEAHYLDLIDAGCRPEQARDVLPNATATTIYMTANMREWRHILRLRTSPRAHPQMRALMSGILAEFTATWPVLFEDLHE